MSDYRTVIIPETVGLFPTFDLSQDGYQLETDDGLETAVILSLFCDARVRDDIELTDINGNRRGWWADSYADVQGDRWGSRLWQYDRSLASQQTASGIRDAARDALKWLIDDGVLDAVDVAVEFLRSDAIQFTVTCSRARNPARRYQFQSFWSGG